MVGRRVLLLLFAFLTLGTPVFATSFTGAITPSTINATTSTLVNVSISNTGGTDINQVIITLPLRFTYLGLGSPGSNATVASFTSSGDGAATNATLTWNATVSSSAANYFSFYVNASVINSWNINVTTTDNSNAVTSANVAITVNDITAPQYISNITSPSPPVTYVKGASYGFSTLWSEGINVSYVIFNWDGAYNK